MNKKTDFTDKLYGDMLIYNLIRLLSRRSPHILWESRLWDVVAGDAHEPFDSTEQLTIASLLLDELEFQRIVFEDNV